MDLFIFIVFQLLLGVQSYIPEPPGIRVSPDVISELSSVKISCEKPANVTVNQCYFSINREKDIKVRPSCELEFTGAEVLIWAGGKSPQSMDIKCYYAINERGINKPSSHSPAATVTVLDKLQKPFISVSDIVQLLVSCEIPLSVRADFNCSFYTEDGVHLHRTSSKRGQNANRHHCTFYPSYNNLFSRSVKSRQLSCDYTLATEDIRSPRSDTVTVRVSQPSVNTKASTAIIKPLTTAMSNSESTTHIKNDVLDYKQEKQGNKKESENVYHLYCIIPDKPAHSNNGDQETV